MIKNIKNMFFFILIVSLSSCKSTRVFTDYSTIKKLNAEEIINVLDKNQNNQSSYSIRFSSKVKFLNKKQTLHGLIRIKKDSIIWLSLGPSIGVELLRVSITPDSVKYINKTNNSYYIGNYNYLKTLLQFEVDYQMVESLLLSNIFVYGSTDSVKNVYKYSSIDSNQYCLMNYRERVFDYLLPSDNIDFKQKVFIDPVSFRIKRIYITDKKLNRSLSLGYINNILVDENMLPEEISFNFENINNLIQLNVKYQKVSYGKDLKYPFKVSKKYSRI